MFMAATARSLKPGTVRETTVEGLAETGARFEFGACRSAHVEAREHRVDDADADALADFMVLFLLRHVAPIVRLQCREATRDARRAPVCTRRRVGDEGR